MRSFFHLQKEFHHTSAKCSQLGMFLGRSVKNATTGNDAVLDLLSPPILERAKDQNHFLDPMHIVKNVASKILDTLLV